MDVNECISTVLPALFLSIYDEMRDMSNVRDEKKGNRKSGRVKASTNPLEFDS